MRTVHGLLLIATTKAPNRSNLGEERFILSWEFTGLSPLRTVWSQTERKQEKGNASIGLGLLGGFESVKLMVTIMHLQTMYKCFFH